MSLAELSVKRPTFITCLVISMLAVGYLSLRKLPIDLFPNISFPIVMVNTAYPGAGPEEIETLVSKILEDEFSSVPGVKTLSSINRDSLSTVVVEFTMETDVKSAESSIRDRISGAKGKLPKDIKEPVVRRLDPSDQPIVQIGITSDLAPGALFEVADQKIRPMIEQVNDVGMVQIIGGRKREIQVQLDQNKLRQREIPASMVASRLQAVGENVPVGKVDRQGKEQSYRALGEFRSLADIRGTIVNFLGNDVPVTIGDIGRVVDTLEDETSRAFVNGKQTLMVMVFKQVGRNTIKVSENVIKKVETLNALYKDKPGNIRLEVVRDGAHAIRANVVDVEESIFLGIFLTVLVVYLFLGSVRSTIITGLALPNSLLGSFVLMAMFGFTINMMTLLALSLAIGLLVDDAIVVRENIFRHIEEGMAPLTAAVEGTKEVTLAVIATSMAVIAVFGPIAFLQGVVGQFFKEFGLTICFAMLISLFDALTIAPMLSAYFAGKNRVPGQQRGILATIFGAPARAFDRFQDWLAHAYGRVLKFSVEHFVVVWILAAALTFGGFAFGILFVPKTFLGAQDFGEFAVGIELEPGASLSAMNDLAQRVDARIRENKEVLMTALSVGGRDNQSNIADMYVRLVPREERSMNTSDFKDLIREQMAEFKFAKPKVKDYDMVAAGMRPFTVNIQGNNLDELQSYAAKIYARTKDHPALHDVDVSYRSGRPEVQIVPDRRKAEGMGIASSILGLELRTLVEGTTPAVYREDGSEYNIRVRLLDEQRDLRSAFGRTEIPNINNSLVRLSDVAALKETAGPANIFRQNRGRYVRIDADMAPNGPGMGAAMTDFKKLFEEELPLPPGLSYKFVGQAENFVELGQNMAVAIGLAILFIYLVLASLYESFVTPFTIMLVLPLAICGAFVALYITGKSLDINAAIGCILLMGIATKNSILLVDYANQQVEKGVSLHDAMLESGKKRLRPILMTTVALIAGMLPIAIGLNEASRQRTSMGVAIIGGLVSSTILSLVVVPASYSIIERFRRWSGAKIKSLFAARAA